MRTGKKMKKLIRSIVVGLLAALIITMPVFADTIEGAKQDFENYQGDEVILQAGDSSTVRILDARGNWIADGILQITNFGNGNIGVLMTTECHIPVDEIMMTVAVDQLIESSNNWNQMEFYTFDYFPEDGKPLTDATLSFQVTGQEPNKWYRLRGLHMVFYGDESEGYSTRTDGIMITD